MLKNVLCWAAEEADGTIHAIQKVVKTKKSKRSNFSMIDNHALCELVLCEEPSKMDYRVLFFLICNMDYDNNAFVTNKFLADAFKLQPSYISLSIKNLKKIGLIMRGKIKGVSCFHVNEHIASRGGIQDAN